ncbi:MAG: hypothetical protein ACLFRP_01155 [Puniceicoccaceae bacterium]
MVLCLAAALLLGAGLLVPAYFQAVDPAVARIAGERGPDLAVTADSLAVGGAPSAADFLTGETIEREAGSPTSPAWNRLLARVGEPERTVVAAGPLLTRADRREAVRILDGSEQPGVATLLAALPPDPPPGETDRLARVLPARLGGILAAFLALEKSFQPGFLGPVVAHARSPGPEDRGWFASFSTDIASWGSLAPFGALSFFAREFEDPSVFTALSRNPLLEESADRKLVLRLVLAGADPEAVAGFLEKYPANGLDDLRSAFAMGPGAARLLLERRKPLREDALLPASLVLSGFPRPAVFAYEHPGPALAARVLFFVGAAFLLLVALARVLPNPGDRYLSRPSAIQNFVRRAILAFVLAGAVLFFLEPSLLHQPEIAPAPAETGVSLSTATLSTTSNPMNTIQIDDVTLLILLIFLALQVGLYIFCLVKLSEIRGQRVDEETKLRLLENEENLFDGGLYLGLGGTVASLIFLAVGVVEASLMAAYASTLFGIIFVSIFKILHLRPLKRRLILSNRAGV